MTPSFRMPRGAHLSDASLASRQRVLGAVLWLHYPVLVVVGLGCGQGLVRSLALPAAVLALAAVAAGVAAPAVRAWATSLGLTVASYVGIELSGGMIEAHFHLFVAVVLIGLYQRWAPLLWAVASVLAHHAVLGLWQPAHVFGHHLPTGAAVGLVLVHAGLLASAVAGVLLLWHYAEAAEQDAAGRVAAAQAARDAEHAAARDAESARAEADRLRAEELATAAGALRADAAAVTALAHQAEAAVTEVGAALGAVLDAMAAVAERSQVAAAQAATGLDVTGRSGGEVARLETSMARIAEVNAMIATLAGQTHLLSLNATIEAARAGDLGKGFAVVASEVKALANETATSAETVRSVIGTLSDDTAAVARSFASTSSVVERVSAVQDEIAAAVADGAARLREVSLRLDEAAAAARDIVGGVERLASGGR